MKFRLPTILTTPKIRGVPHHALQRRIPYAAANNYHLWYDINRSNGDRDLKQFVRETNALHVHIHARNTPQSSPVATGGWEDFFSQTLRIGWTVGTTPLNALPHATFLPVTPVCTAFGASSWTPEHLLRYTQHTCTAILYRPDCLTAKERTRWFDFFDEKMRLPPSEDPDVRMYVLVNRCSCRLTNAWLDAYERSGRFHTLASMKHMQFKHMHADGTRTWVRDLGPWDLCLIEHCKTQWRDLNTHEIARTLRTLTHRTRYPGARQHIPDAFQCYPSARNNNRCFETFYKEWDRLADARYLLLKKRRVDWPAVDNNLQEANRLLVNSPCPRLARVARLAHIPIGGSLRKASILIYAVVGRFAPYVGQLGGKTRRPRTTLGRLTEHLAGSNNLRRHFTGERRRNLRTMGRIGGCASLPRTLARLGSHKASILPLQHLSLTWGRDMDTTSENQLATHGGGIRPLLSMPNSPLEKRPIVMVALGHKWSACRCAAMHGCMPTMCTQCKSKTSKRLNSDFTRT